MQKLTTAATIATSVRQSHQDFRHPQQRNQTQGRKTNHQENFINDENLGMHYYQGHHSKNPSFNLTSEISRQLNQSVSESKYRIRSGQSSMTQCELSSALVNQRKPKEIEEFFESTRNFYQNKGAQHAVGYRDNQQMLNYQRTVFSDQKNTLNSMGGQNTSTNLGMKVTTASSSKKQGPSGKVAKKVCNEEDYNTLITYKERKSSDNSIGSSISSSPSATTSLQKHTQFENVQHKPPCTLKGLEFQTFSIPSSTNSQKQQLFQEIKNISSTLNSKAIKNQNYMRDKTPLHMVHPGSQMKLALSSERGSIINQRAQFTSLDSCRIQQKLMKQSMTGNQENNASQFPVQSKTSVGRMTLTAVKPSSHQLSITNQKSMPRQSNVVSVTKLNLAQPLHVQKVQDKPQAKKLNESSDEETIDSHDMSNSRIAKELANDDSDKYEILQKPPRDIEDFNFTINHHAKSTKHQQQTHHQLLSNQTSVVQFQAANFCNDTQSRLQTTQSNTDQIISQTNVPLSATHRIQHLNHLQANNYRSTSSASKRAKWDLSASKQHTLQNSVRRGSDSETGGNTLLQCKLNSKQHTEDEESKFQLLHQQYMAIKKQLMELKINQKKSKRNEVSQQDDRHIVGVLSPDRDDSGCSENTPNADNSYEIDLTENRHSKSLMHRHKTIDHHHQSTSILKTHQKPQRKKKTGTQFKSLDVQFLPQILQTSLKPDGNQSPRMTAQFKTAVKEQHNKSKLSRKENSRQMHHEESQFLKASAMKSQLQIGLRKLSINQQLQEQELLKRKLQLKQQNHSKSQGKRQANRSVLKTSKSNANHKKQNSQVSFVDVKSESSEDRYQDCLSGGRSTNYGRSRCRMPRCGSVLSSGSSKYYMAHDDDDSICSCC